MYKGACLCGTVRFLINGPIHNIVYCHCSMCRKAQGTAFASNGVVANDDFSFVQGEDNLSAYQSSPGQHKYFCKTCGSPILSRNVHKPLQLRIRLGVIESDIDERPEAHIFMSSKAVWEELDAQLPRYDGYEPSR